jgi:hypothetical protein
MGLKRPCPLFVPFHYFVQLSTNGAVQHAPAKSGLVAEVEAFTRPVGASLKRGREECSQFYVFSRISPRSARSQSQWPSAQVPYDS